MGWLFNNSKKVAGRFFNFRIDQWVDYENIKSTALFIMRQTKFLFSSHKPNNTQHIGENFEEAKLRLNLTDEDLVLQAIQYKRFTLFFLLLSMAVFLYALFLIAIQRNIMGFCMAFSLTLYGLSQAVRYHFWYFQIQRKKLGCSLQEWWSALLKRGT